MIYDIIITILLLFYGYINIVFENKLAAPFLAIVMIYLIWKIHNMNEKLKEKDRKLDEIKNLLEKSLNEKSESEEKN